MANLILALFGFIAIASLIGALYINYKDSHKKILKSQADHHRIEWEKQY